MNIFIRKASLLPPSARKPAAIRAACARALRLEKCRARGELNVIFLDRAAMRRMNRTFLHHDWDTDVVAFRYSDGRPSEALPFGDVYVSAHMARRQAKEIGHSVLDEVLTLAVHGTLHLLGWDDATARQKKRMFARQDQILRRS